MTREGASAEIERLGRTLGEGRDPALLAGDPTLRALVREGVDAIGAAAGGIFMLDAAGANLELAVAVRYPEPLADRYRLIPLAANVPLVDSVRRQAPIFLAGRADYAALYPDFAGAHPELTQSAFAALPLRLDGGCAGALVFGFGAARSFTADDRASLIARAGRCEAEIARLHAAEAAAAARARAALASQRLERLHAFTGTLAQAITPDEVVTAAIDVGLTTTAAASGALWLASPDGASLVLARKVAIPDAADLDRVPTEGAPRVPLHDVVRDDAPVWIESRRQLHERYPEAAERLCALGHESCACLPLLVQGRRIGVLTYGFEEPHRFLEDERAFLQVIAWYTAQTLERANLLAAEKGAKERAQDGQRRSELIADIDMLLASSLDLPNILSEVARAAVPRFADWCVLELAAERLRGAPPVASHADLAKVPRVLELNRRLRGLAGFDQGIAAVLRSGVAKLHAVLTPQILERHLGADPALVKLAAEVGTASALVVPIAARGQVLGVIVLSRVDPAQAFDARDLAVAEELGRRIGLAVDNARLYQDARDADRLKDEFLAMLSHELRNPLAPIVSALDVMETRGEPHLVPERALIARNVRHLVRLLDDLLDVARTTRGQVHLVKERCEVASIVTAAVEMANPLVAQRAHRLVISVPARGLEVIGDHARLTQAVANLVTNAAKYTPPGGTITVAADVDRTADGAGGHAEQLVLRVRDSGAGIAADLLPRIFNLFVQGASDLDRSQAGLGIGLTVARNIVRLHGGTISAHSAGIGQGSEFVVRLARAAPAADVAAAPTAAAPPPAVARRTPGRRWRVLAVDDNRDAATMLGRALEALGCAALVVHDGAAAIASAETFEPEIVLLDIGLPGIDGYEVARRLRAARRDPALRIVAVTGYGLPSDRLRSQGAGFDDHLVKPLSLDVLRQVLDDHASRESR